jgi:hypothetical protein
MGKFVPCLRYSSNFPGTEFTIRWHYITAPYTMEEKPHAHDFDQFSLFIGGNPMNIRDFGAEVELYMGEEGIKHVINTTTVVHIPKGMVHGPLIYKKVDRPIMFINVPQTAVYTKK